MKHMILKKKKKIFAQERQKTFCWGGGLWDEGPFGL